MKKAKNGKVLKKRGRPKKNLYFERLPELAPEVKKALYEKSIYERDKNFNISNDVDEGKILVDAIIQINTILRKKPYLAKLIRHFLLVEAL